MTAWQPCSSMSFLQATGRSLNPGTVDRTGATRAPMRSHWSSTAAPMSKRANVVSAIPIFHLRSRAAPPGGRGGACVRFLLVARALRAFRVANLFHRRDLLLEGQSLLHLRDDFPRAVKVETRLVFAQPDN